MTSWSEIEFALRQKIDWTDGSPMQGFEIPISSGQTVGITFQMTNLELERLHVMAEVMPLADFDFERFTQDQHHGFGPPHGHFGTSSGWAKSVGALAGYTWDIAMKRGAVAEMLVVKDCVPLALLNPDHAFEFLLYIGSSAHSVREQIANPVSRAKSGIGFETNGQINRAT